MSAQRDAVLALCGRGVRPDARRGVRALGGSPGRAWCAVAALIATGGALALILAPPWTALDWQPGLAATQPWRALTPLITTARCT